MKQCLTHITVRWLSGESKGRTTKFCTFFNAFTPNHAMCLAFRRIMDTHKNCAPLHGVVFVMTQPGFAEVLREKWSIR